MKYRQVAYLNLTDSSSIVRLQSIDDDGYYCGDVFAVGYQEDGALHLISDDDADNLIDQAGNDWEEFEDWEQTIVEAEQSA